MTAASLFKKQLFFYACIFSFILTGCTGLNSNFSCPMQPGVQCNSLDQVNTMIDQGKVGAKRTTGNSNLTTATIQNQAATFASLSNSSANPEWLRQPETVMRIWIAPYQDQDGNYHQPGTLYSVVKPGQWAISAVN